MLIARNGEASAPERKISWIAKRVEQAEQELQRIAGSNTRKEAAWAQKLPKESRRLARAEPALTQARRCEYLTETGLRLQGRRTPQSCVFLLCVRERQAVALP